MILMLVSRLTFFAASTLLFASVLAAEDAKSSTEPVSSSVDEAIFNHRFSRLDRLLGSVAQEAEACCRELFNHESH